MIRVTGFPSAAEARRARTGSLEVWEIALRIGDRAPARADVTDGVAAIVPTARPRVERSPASCCKRLRF
jgi:hypothetical protein